MEDHQIQQRWERYRKANSDKPAARENELRNVFALLNPLPGEKIWEVGTGNGYLTFPIATAVGDTGAVITTDVSEGNIADVERTNAERKLRIEARLLPLESPLLGAEFEEHFDAVATIATLHHFDNRKIGTGEAGRINALRTFFKSLKRGGRLVVSDPLDGTITQRYFDAIDTPHYCNPDGHPH